MHYNKKNFRINVGLRVQSAKNSIVKIFSKLKLISRATIAKNFEMDVFFFFYEQERYHHTIRYPTNRIFSIQLVFNVNVCDVKTKNDHHLIVHSCIFFVQWTFTTRIYSASAQNRYLLCYLAFLHRLGKYNSGGEGEREKNPLVDENPWRIHASGIAFSKIVLF